MSFSKKSQTTRRRKNAAAPKEKKGTGRKGRPAGAVNKATLDMLASEGINLETYIKVREIMRTKKST